MVDYDLPSGASGTVRIRDSGLNVSFMITSNDAATWWGNVAYQGYLNGSIAGNFGYPAGYGWFTIRSGAVRSDQTVWFDVNGTGTYAVGNPPRISASIKRATVPGAPRNVNPTVNNARATQMRVSWSAPSSNGGAAINAYRLRYSSSNPPTGNGTTGSSPRLFSISRSGIWVYVQVAARNSVGWGPWSSVASVLMRNKPDPPRGLKIDQITHTSMRYEFESTENNGGALTARNYRYGTSSNLASATVRSTSTGFATLTGLEPGTRYYIQSRVSNLSGDSGWSSVMSATTLAGVYVKTPSGQAVAIPMVKVDGVWKAAEAYVKDDEVWKAVGK